MSTACASAPDNFIVQAPSQLLEEVPANIPRTPIPVFTADLILSRSPQIRKIRHLRIL